MSFTPGPWRIGKIRSTVVGDTPVHGIGGSDATDYYGGHLIGESAAPDLLEMLKQSHEQLHKLVSVFVSNTDGAHAETTALMREMRAAIEKAVQE